jgi:nicotinamide-nucleotide amidase
MDVPREIGELMRRAPRLTLAAAESMTCGRVQARIGEVSGASEFFLGGITAYTLEQKVRHLGVERADAAACKCVSATVAEQMARGAAALFGADVGVATTGFAEPTDSILKVLRPEGRKSDTAEMGLAEPFAFWAVAWREPGRAWGTRTGQVVCLGAGRTAAQALVADVVLAELRAQLRAMRTNTV